MEERKFLEHTEYGRTDKFEIVDSFIESYQVWHIGREHFPFECYIPLCSCDANYHVNTSTLKCFKVESEEMALAAMSAAAHAKKADKKWFEKWCEVYPMNFEQKCKFLIGKRVDYITINKVDKFATREERGFFRLVSHGFIGEDHVNFWIRLKGYHSEICVNYTKEFVEKLVLDGINSEMFCGGYYRNYFLK